MTSTAGTDLLIRPPVVTLGEREVPLVFDMESWAALQAHFGTPTLGGALAEAAMRLQNPGAEDLILITWAALRHLETEAPTIEAVSRLKLTDLLGATAPLTVAFEKCLPKDRPLNPKTPATVTGTGRLRTLWSRLSGAVRGTTFGV